MKRFFLFILILTAFVSCGESADNEIVYVDKSTLTVDGLLYETTVCSFVKLNDRYVLSLNSETFVNEEKKYANIIFEIKNKKIKRAKVSTENFMIDSETKVKSIFFSDSQISGEIEVPEFDRTIKHKYKFDCKQEVSLNEYPKYFPQENTESELPRACSVLKTSKDEYLTAMASVKNDDTLMGFYGKTNNDYPYGMFFVDSSDGFEASYGFTNYIYEFTITDNILKGVFKEEENYTQTTIECEIGKSVVK